jgi:hypothetical protein
MTGKADGTPKRIRLRLDHRLKAGAVYRFLS